MFNFGMGEMLIIAVIALIFIGPKQLPEVARTIAKLVNEWRRTTSDLSQSLMEARDVTETAVRKATEDIMDEGDIAESHHHNDNDEAEDNYDHLEDNEAESGHHQEPSENMGPAGTTPLDPNEQDKKEND